jgi:hypothetical protein
MTMRPRSKKKAARLPERRSDQREDDREGGRGRTTNQQPGTEGLNLQHRAAQTQCDRA